ncbi:DUF1330 domain-containing protein [Undibacterium sp. Ren11W]|uniref:DUF1330 domain-containing protein n=1 Tax=Undibacterium sp. Ren11W TaxID=3413045 RepID=UPI003BF16177
MAAYAIGSITVHNTDWQKEYGEKMPALILRHQGRLLARSAPQKLEGDLQVGAMIVMIEFPTAEHAQAWYTDPEHEHLKQLRRSGADFDLLLVNGI